jgi:hypothetical protein
LLHNVYIFKEDGVCLFTRKYGSLETDEAIVAGFLSAISNFGEQIGTTTLQRLDFGDYRIILINTRENLITAGVIDKDDDVFVMETALKKLTLDFKSHYGNIKDSAVNNTLFDGYAENADRILQLISDPQETIKKTRNLSEVIKQMKHKFDVILEVIASGKPLFICSKSREITEMYVHTLAALRPVIDLIPWTDDENAIFTLKHRKNLIIGVPITYLMKLAEDEKITIVNITYFRIHGAVKTSKKWKEAAKYAIKQIDELGDEGITKYIQSRMDN